jgi:asparagine synthase (glutamine-hydrolysing)
MCGIAGFAGSGTRADLERMAAALAHRGPDDEGFVCERGVGLAHKRLSIIDLTPGGHQPMWNDDKNVALVFNGEIYNFQSLRDDLRKQGAVFHSQSDTEVLMRLYERDGERCFDQLVGMFAVALYDFRKHALVLARDPMGEKPLYWSLQDGTLLFASELGALMMSGLVKKELRLASLDAYLLHDFVPTPHTMLEGVYKLEPGTTLTYADGEVRKRAFWSPPTSISMLSEGEAIAELDRRLHASVTGQLVSDAPLGVYLSGGIDSSTVAWYAAQHAGRTIDTFSIGFDDEHFDESNYARQVAKHLGTEHHERIVTAQDALATIPSIADVFSEPVADASVIPTLLLSGFARERVKVSLGGDGADELFAGYPTFAAEQAYGLYGRLPGQLRVMSRSVIDHLRASERNFSPSFALKRFVSSDREEREYRHAEWLGSFTEEARARLSSGRLEDAVRHADPFAEVGRYMKEYTQQDEMNRLLYIYARTYLMDEVLVKVDRASMHHSLEVRAPFLDHRIVELAFSLPYAYKYRNFETKRLLKKLMTGRLPDAILHRQKKGFGIPLACWLKHELKGLTEDLLSEKRLEAQGLFDPRYVLQLRTNHLDGKTDNRKQLWNLMVFQMWYDRWMSPL